MAKPTGGVKPSGSTRPQEERRFTTELTNYIINNIGKRGFVKEVDVRKVYSSFLDNYHGDSRVIMKRVDKRLEVLRWKLVTVDARMYAVNMLAPSAAPQDWISAKAHCNNGILYAALLYIMVAKSPSAADDGIPAEDLDKFLEKVLATDESEVLEKKQKDHLKKLIAPSKHAIFVKQGWIKVIEKMVNEDQRYAYDWGPHAIATINAPRLVVTFAELYPENPANFVKQARYSIQLKELQLSFLKKEDDNVQKS